MRLGVRKGRCLRGAALVSLFLALAPLARAIPDAYIANENDGTVSVLDTSTGTVVATIPVGSNPVGVAVSPDGSRVYVTNFGSNTVSVIDTANETVVATVPVAGPYGVAVSPDGSRVYVSGSANGGVLSNEVSVIDAADDQVVHSIIVGTGALGLAVSPDGKRLYVANYFSDDVSVVDTASDEVVATIPAGTDTYGAAVSPDGSRLYVTNFEGDSVSMIDTASDTVVATVSVAGPYGVAVSPNGSRVYVVGGASSGAVTVIDTANDQIIDTIALGDTPYGVSVSPDGSRLYVTNSGSNTVSVVDTNTDQVVDTVDVGSSPRSLGTFVGPGALIAMNSSDSGSAGMQVSGTVPALTNTTSCGTTDTEVENPARGSVTLDAGTGAFTYTPTSTTYSGPDAFTWHGEAPASCTAADSPTEPQSNVATVSLNLAPLVSGLADLTLGEGRASQESFSLTGSTPFTHVLVSDNATVLPPAALTVAPAACGADAAHLTCTLDVTAAAVAGTAGITVAAKDRYGDPVSARLTVNVAAPPTVTDLTTVTVTAPATGTETLTLGGTGPLTVTTASSNTTLLPDGNIGGQGGCTSAGSCTLTLQPVAGGAGTATVTVTVSDGYGQSASGTFDVTVAAASGGGGGSSGGGGASTPAVICGLGLLTALSRRRCRRRC